MSDQASVGMPAARLAPTVRPLVLGGVVAAGGAGSLATEICASRLLAPYFGSSTVVWANVIGLILVYLSVGYWVGGRVADRHATPRALGRIMLAAALCIAALPFVAHPVLRLALDGFERVEVGAVAGSFFATLALFSVPVTLLGMVSPFALRLALTDVARAGETSGRLSALATLGAIAGTFAPGLLLIPAIGTQRTMILAALVVAAASALLLERPALLAVLAIGALLAIPPGAVKPLAGAVDERETAYGYAQVIRFDDGRTVMRLDEGVADQSVYRPGVALTGGEWDMPLVAPPLLGRPLRTALVIGNAGGTTARALAATYPGVRIDGVELDPALTDLARSWFALDAIPGLTTHTGDGRVFLETTDARWDLIVVDAYQQAYIPFHLVTREFFSLVRDHLTPGGAVALNVARTPGDDDLPRAVSQTLATVLPQVRVWPALRFNELVLGLETPLTPLETADRLRSAPSAIRSLVPLFAAATTAAPADDPMTDDRAPVEWLTDRALVDYITRGGRFDEQLLPTAP
ncbi:MAG TPA: fused MFS/spermidine synthase [Candidatus Dormibacteraeota bacterium]|nr:fused MFS/spermidine synthase [Candidatus Dormibacteraeota bacterium]